MKQGKCNANCKGDFVEDDCHGKGKFIFASGNVYEGDFVEDKRHGKGTLTFADGDVYEGSWKKDKAHGQGTCPMGFQQCGIGGILPTTLHRRRGHIWP